MNPLELEFVSLLDSFIAVENQENADELGQLKQRMVLLLHGLPFHRNPLGPLGVPFHGNPLGVPFHGIPLGPNHFFRHVFGTILTNAETLDKAVRLCRGCNTMFREIFTTPLMFAELRDQGPFVLQRLREGILRAEESVRILPHCA